MRAGAGFSSGMLLPRLDFPAADEIRSEIGKAAPAPVGFDQSRLEDLLTAHSEVPATGGSLVEIDRMLELREDLVSARSSSAGDNGKFDLAAGRILWSWAVAVPGEFGVPAVWDFVALGLVPDLVSSRFDLSSPSSRRDRLFGGSRRHVLQRLWRRWRVLGPEILENDVLVEDDYVALFERRLTSERPQVAQAVARALMKHAGSSRRAYTRAFQRHLMMLSGIVAIDDADPDSLDQVIHHIDRSIRQDPTS